MTEFLSEENIKKHTEYARQLRLKYSILEKSVKDIKSLNIREIARQKLKKREKAEAIRLKGEVLAHDVFFDSFFEHTYCPCREVENAYGSVSAFLNLVYRRCMETAYGYVGIIVRGGRAEPYAVSEGYQLFDYGEPLLAVDVCEHTYFYDYGFDKEKFLIQALPHLRLDKISDFLKMS